MKIGFFCFGGARIGFGHVARCISLANTVLQVGRGVELSFYVEPSEPAVLMAISNALPAVKIVPSQPEKGQRWSLLFVDRLDMPEMLMRRLKAQTDCLISIDDRGVGHWFADISVGSLYKCSVPKPNFSSTKSYIGVEYSLLDSTYYQVEGSVKERPENVLIVQGAGDPHCLLGTLIEEIEDVMCEHPWANMHVLTGPTYKDEHNLVEVLARSPMQIIRHRSISKPAAFYAGMDVAVSSAGVTATELAVLGIPAILVTGEEKEVETAFELELLGVARAVGLYVPAKGEYIRRHLRAFMSDRSFREAVSKESKKNFRGKWSSRSLIEMALELVQ